MALTYDYTVRNTHYLQFAVVKMDTLLATWFKSGALRWRQKLKVKERSSLWNMQATSLLPSASTSPKWMQLTVINWNWFDWTLGFLVTDLWYSGRYCGMHSRWPRRPSIWGHRDRRVRRDPCKLWTPLWLDRNILQSFQLSCSRELVAFNRFSVTYCTQHSSCCPILQYPFFGFADFSQNHFNLTSRH